MLDDIPPTEAIDVRGRAFDYHKDADSLFHGRVNAMLVSQSMMLTGFAISCNWTQPHNLLSKLFPELVVITAILTIILFWQLNRKLHRRLEYLKGILVSQCTVYKDYLLTSVGHEVLAQRNGALTPITLPHILPFVFLIFWISAGILYIVGN